ncbi:MAG: SDR family oxidoreductase [Solirubrobacteraceae bacterium]
MADRTILFTGFPGFIGARLIPRLLDADPAATIVALVEERMVDRAREAAAGLGVGDRVQIQPGDITDPRLGLDDAVYERLLADVVAVHHLAAIYDLAVPQAIAERVNVAGTRHIVDFCRAAPRLERHHYVSTAYVGGLRGGRVKESDLDAGQEFKNHYESTKYAAEVIVRDAMVDVPTTIYRPGIVVGDSRTGETQKFDGPYYLLRAIAATARRHLPLGIVPGLMTAPMNIVPVDFIVDAIVTGASYPEFAGETLHLVDPSPIPAGELYRMLTEEYGGSRFPVTLPLRVVEPLLKVRPISVFFGRIPLESLTYLDHHVVYDTRRATELLGAHGVRCPPVSEYVGPMVRFFREHEKDAAYDPGR